MGSAISRQFWTSDCCSRPARCWTNWIPKLKVYVPTAAHRKAVKALNEHGVVLLLGNPPHRHQTRSKAGSTRSYHRMVTLT
jgi:hypothetical protein